MVEQTASGSALAARPERGLILWYIIFAQLFLGPTWVFRILDSLLHPHGLFDSATRDVDMAALIAADGYPVGAILLAILAAIAAVIAGGLLLFGRTRYQLHQAIFLSWLAWPGHMMLVFAWHCFRLWRDNVELLDVRIWLNQIISMLVGAALVSAYLLLSKRMRARFPKSTVDVAAIF